MLTQNLTTRAVDETRLAFVENNMWLDWQTNSKIQSQSTRTKINAQLRMIYLQKPKLEVAETAPPNALKKWFISPEKIKNKLSKISPESLSCMGETHALHSLH